MGIGSILAPSLRNGGRLAAVSAIGLATLVCSGGATADLGTDVPRFQIAAGARFATYNASLNRYNAGDLVNDLSTPDNEQAKVIAEVIQRYRPEVLLVNEFDYDENHEAIALFQQNYLSISQNGATPIEYPYCFVAPSNTGIPSGYDLNNDGEVGGPDDAFGFGYFPGQYGMAVYSLHPIDADNIRTFQLFLWKDMPDAMLPIDPDTGDPWYTDEELEVFRLSSKSHWDLPIVMGDRTVHFLCSHPTPPTFDGEEDRNGTRNHDEVRFWADYVDPAANSYIYDDDGSYGGLAEGDLFVIVGDQNSDPYDGDSVPGTTQQLLDSAFINTIVTPSSEGGVEQAALQGGANDDHIGDPAYDTADFTDDPAPGNLRADYALPSANLPLVSAGVFWPLEAHPMFPLLGVYPFPSSDHRPVWVDLALPGTTMPSGVASGDVTQTTAVLLAYTRAIGDVTFEWGLDENYGDSAVVTIPDRNIIEPVKHFLTDLMPGMMYYYCATDAAGSMAAGSFRTSDDLDVSDGFRFGIAGDWQQAPPYPSLSNFGEQDLEVFVKLGDTIYADLDTPINPGFDQARTLDDFRLKHAEVVSERFGVNFMKDVYENTPVIGTTDDHEVVDNFAGGAAPGDSPDADPPLFTDPVDYVNDTVAYEEAFQAFQEYHPFRNDFWTGTNDPRTEDERKLYRFNYYGSDAAIFVLDSRSFRDAQLDPGNPFDPAPFLFAAYDSTRTMLSRAQVNQLKNDLLAAKDMGITWKFIVIPEPIQNFGVVNAEDRFEGYAAERAEILHHLEASGIENVIFMAGDFHGTVVNNLTFQFAPLQDQYATGAFEVMTGPVAFFNGLFGPTVVQLAFNYGLIDQGQYDLYNSLPVANDMDSDIDDKDDFVKFLINSQTGPLGYDPVGLNENLPVADGRIDAELLAGDYIAVHTFGWTEFDIDAQTSALLVTTYGIAPYSEEDLLADADDVINRVPEIVSQFSVQPQVEGPACPADVNLDGAVDIDDLFAVLSYWGTTGGFGDVNNDDNVDIDDVFAVLAEWGPCS